MKKRALQIAATGWKNWQDFWFGSVDLLPLSAFRAALGFLTFLFVISRTGDLAFFYSDSGLLPTSYAQTVEYLIFQKSIFHYYDSLTLMRVCHALLLLSLATLTIGFFSRTSAVAAYILNLMFVNRNPAVQYGVDFIGIFMMFYLMFTNSGARLSVDAWLKNRKRGAKLAELWSPAPSDIVSSTFFRLMQIQVCIIYFYSGIAKLKGTRWWNGSAIWDVFTMEGLIRFDLSFVAYFPHVLVVACYLVLLWEIYFPVLIWVRAARLPLVWFGTLMHIGFGFMLQIPIFGALMCAVYLLFIDADRIRAALSSMFVSRRKIARA